MSNHPYTTLFDGQLLDCRLVNVHKENALDFVTHCGTMSEQGTLPPGGTVDGVWHFLAVRPTEPGAEVKWDLSGYEPRSPMQRPSPARPKKPVQAGNSVSVASAFYRDLISPVRFGDDGQTPTE